MNFDVCPFCGKAPVISNSKAHADYFFLYTCEGCQEPKYETKFRLLRDKKTFDLLSISVKIDDYHIIYRFVDPRTRNSSLNTTVFKNLLPAILREEGAGAPEVFEVDYILELPLSDIEATMNKLNIYSTFS